MMLYAIYMVYTWLDNGEDIEKNTIWNRQLICGKYCHMNKVRSRTWKIAKGYGNKMIISIILYMT